MSYILKALKKLEQEKATRRVSPPDIQSAILAPEQTTDGTLRTFLVSAVILLLLCGCILAYVLLQRYSHSSATSVLNSIPSTSHPNSPSTASPAPHTLQREEFKATAEGPTSSNNPTYPTVQLNRVEPSPSTPMPQAVNAFRSRPDGREASVAPESGLKVNGIALQDDPDESVAIVNGVLAHRGTTVQGMRIEEIFSDRVRFSGNGDTFEVKISK